jgi:hypothetical protein
MPSCEFSAVSDVLTTHMMLGHRDNVSSSGLGKQFHHVIRLEILCIPLIEKVIIGSASKVLLVVRLAGTAREAHGVVVPLGVWVMLVTMISHLSRSIASTHTSSSGILCSSSSVSAQAGTEYGRPSSAQDSSLGIATHPQCTKMPSLEFLNHVGVGRSAKRS